MNEEQIQQLIQLLVQAGAAQDENQAMQIIQMASQGDQQAQQVVQQVVQQAQQTVSAKLGAKLRYLSKLKGICPEGQEMVYFKAGGRICKACQGKKMQKGGVTTDTTKVKKPITVGNKKKSVYDKARETNPVLKGKTDAQIQAIWNKNKKNPQEGVPTRAKGGILANKGTAFGDGTRGANPRNTDKGGHKSHGNTNAASYMKKTNVPNKFTAFGDTGKKKPTNVGLVGHKKTGKTGRMQSKYTVSDNVNKHTAFGAHINRSHRQQAACPSTKGWKSIKGAPKGHGGKGGWQKYANGGTLTEAFVNYFQKGGSLNGIPFTRPQEN